MLCVDYNISSIERSHGLLVIESENIVFCFQCRSTYDRDDPLAFHTEFYGPQCFKGRDLQGSNSGHATSAS